MTTYCLSCRLEVDDSLLSGGQQMAMRAAHQRSAHTELPRWDHVRPSVRESRNALTPISRTRQRSPKVYRQPEIEPQPSRLPVTVTVKRRRAAKQKRLNVIKRARSGNTDTRGLLALLAGHRRAS